MANSTIIIGFLLVIAFACDTFAQDAPTASQLEQERTHIEGQRKQNGNTKSRATQPTRGAMPDSTAILEEIRRIEPERKAMFDPENAATKNAPNTFPHIDAPERANIDIEAIARQYGKKAAARKMDDLMVFASFSMPAESLKRLVRQAHQVGASVILRGFKDNSLKATALAINELGEQGGNVLVNPNAFTKYKINGVPAVVLAKADSIDQADNDGCALPDNFVSVSGDVSLDFALDEIVRRSPQFEPVATRYLRQMRGH